MLDIGSVSLAMADANRAGALRRNNRIIHTRGNQDCLARQVDRPRLRQWSHRPQQARTRERCRLKQQHGGSDIGAVRIAERDRRCDAVVCARFLDESASSFARRRKSVLIEYAFAKTSEEPRHAGSPRPCRVRDRRGAPGATMRPSGTRSFSSPPVRATAGVSGHRLGALFEAMNVGQCFRPSGRQLCGVEFGQKRLPISLRRALEERRKL